MPFTILWLIALHEYLTTRRPRMALVVGLVLGIGVYSYLAAALLMPVYLLATCVVLAFQRDWPACPARGCGFRPADVAVACMAGDRTATLFEHPDGVPPLRREPDDEWRTAPADGERCRADRSRQCLLGRVQPGAAVLHRRVEPADFNPRGGVAARARGGLDRDGSCHLAAKCTRADRAAVGRGTHHGATAGRDHGRRRDQALAGRAAVRCDDRRNRRGPPPPRWSTLGRATTAVLVALMALQFAAFTRDYFGAYRERSSIWFGGNIRAALEMVLADARARTPSMVYIASDIPWVEAYWRFYSTVHGQSLLERTRYVRLQSGEIPAAVPDAVIVTPILDLALEASLRSAGWASFRAIPDLDGHPSLTVGSPSAAVP